MRPKSGQLILSAHSACCVVNRQALVDKVRAITVITPGIAVAIMIMQSLTVRVQLSSAYLVVSHLHCLIPLRYTSLSSAWIVSAGQQR